MRVAKDKLNMVTLVGLDPEHQILSHVGRPERAGIALGIGSVHLGHCWNNHGGVDAPSADDVAYAPPPHQTAPTQFVGSSCSQNVHPRL